MRPTRIALWLGCAGLLLGTTIVPCEAVAESVFRTVRHDNGDLAVDGQGTAVVRFYLNRAAQVILDIADVRDRVVAQVESEGTLDAGEHSISWRGKDFRDRPVPPGAYSYRLRASTSGGETELRDRVRDRLETRTEWKDSRWDPATGSVSYVLKSPSRVRVRVGFKDNGPLLRTLVDWVARGPGRHAESWDGWDANRAVHYSNDSRVSALVEYFALPINTILVGPPSDVVGVIEDAPATAKPDATKDADRPDFAMFDYASQSFEERRDFDLELRVPPTFERDEEGRIHVSGPLPISVQVPTEVKTRLLDERFEAVYFVDERMVYEIETAFLPITWTWSPEGQVEGEHTIHVNLRGFNGHFGIAGMRIVLDREGIRSVDGAGSQQ